MTTWTETIAAEAGEYVEDDYCEPDYVDSSGWGNETAALTPIWTTT